MEKMLGKKVVKVLSDDLSANDYFEFVKQTKKIITEEEITEFRSNAIHLLQKYEKTNQLAAMKKLMLIINNFEKEIKIVNKGIDEYVLVDDIKTFIKKVSSNVVKIIELKNYPREIPDDVLKKYEDVKDLFDEFYVLFTDYTGEVEKQVIKSKRDKDPILFGAFVDKEKEEVLEKFYYIGDWIDEYCDLTLEKMVREMNKNGHKDVVKVVNVKSDVKAIEKKLSEYVYLRGSYEKVEKPTLIQKIKKWLGKR